MVHPETFLREQKMSQDKESLSYDILPNNMAGLYYVDYLNISHFDKPRKGSSEFKMNPVLYSVGISTILIGCVVIFLGFTREK